MSLSTQQKCIKSKLSVLRRPMHGFYNIINSALINSHILCTHVFKEDTSRKKFIQTVYRELSENMPGNSPEHKDMLEKPPCKVSCVAERSGLTSKLLHLTCCFASARIEQQITSLLVSNTYVKLMLKPIADSVFQNKFVAFLESMCRYSN